MDVVAALREQLGSAHWLLEETMNSVTPEVFHWRPQGSAVSIADNYLHTVVGEDQTVHALLQGKTARLAALDPARTGLSSLPAAAHGSTEWAEWIATVKVDLGAFRKSAADVYVATDAYINDLSAGDLARPVDLAGYGLGVQSLNWALYNFLIGHIAQHTGEISALKGFQGLQGYPF